LIFAIAAFARKYQNKVNNEFRKICEHYYNAHRDLFLDAILYFFAALFSFSFHYSRQTANPNPEMLAGVVLCVSIFTGAYNVLALFKPHPENEVPPTIPAKQIEKLQPQKDSDSKQQNNFQPLVVALYALTLLPLLMLLNRNYKKRK
jgi:hypothetical protein